ncbi:hypothetical protein GGS24DRAFT_439686 [Hypoxylon argillaceum]|nr:hypothetical protein GGS24DRAFT_439686 [Hypoxylon argillaceum]
MLGSEVLKHFTLLHVLVGYTRTSSTQDHSLNVDRRTYDSGVCAGSRAPCRIWIRVDRSWWIWKTLFPTFGALDITGS